ncbi:MAG: L,D-transpeptidase [Polyangiales bacterium]
MLRFGSALALVALVAVAACGGREEGPRERLLPPAPPPPAAPPEPTIAQGICAIEQADVHVEPNAESRVRGILRWGARFALSDRRDVNGETWWRVRAAGWVKGTDVRTKTDGEPQLGFIPFQPKLDRPMPYNIARVIARDGVPVYRRPPPRGEPADRYVMRTLREGYFFTLDKAVNIYDRQLYRGITYWFIPREGTTPVVAPDFEGVPVTREMRFPFLWVTDPTARLCANPLAPGQPGIAFCEPIARHSRIPLVGQRNVQGGVWYQVEGGKWIPYMQVARVHEVERLPSGLHEGERWIHVDLRNQFAALYEGREMKFVTLISSGDDQHPTPTGTYRLESRHITARMDSEDNPSGAYFIQDVPWVMYFKGGYALHGAFWHDRFGLKTSHGCVNLAPRDARRFFEFATSPALPPGLHGVFTQPDEQGTLVHVTN